ncbi:MAG TPA: YfhO family protein, partial [Anaerolineaceae bacterium]|nr:YfhO family protein [Anaerolineaceae bacterium]
ANGDFNAYANFWEGAVYSGFLPFALALTTLLWLVRGRKGDRRLTALPVFLWLSIGIGVLLALGKFTPVFPWLYHHVPTFAMFQAPARFMVWPAFAISFLAALAADRWMPASEKTRRNLRRGIAASVAVVLAGGIGWFVLSELRLPMFAATAGAGVCALAALVLALTISSQPEGRPRTRWESLVILFIALDLLLAGWGLNPVTRAEIYAPEAQLPDAVNGLAGGRMYLPPDDEYVLKFQRFFRFADFQPIDDWTHVRTTQLPNINLLDGVSLANNFDPMVPARYARWMDALADLPPTERTPWLQAMGVTLVERIDVNEAGGVRFDTVSGGERVRWWGCARPVTGEEAAWQAVQQRMAGEGRCLVIEVAAQPVKAESTGSGAAPVIRIQAQRANRITIQVDTPQPGWLQLADVWYPGWKAAVDGQETPILRADYLFRAVYLPAGAQVVEFRYEPASYRIGGLVTALGLLVLAAICFFSGKRPEKYN